MNASLGCGESVDRAYKQGYIAALHLKEKDTCPYHASDLKSYCAWMAGYNDWRITNG